MDDNTSKLFHNIKDALNSGLLNTFFAFWISYFVFEPNMFYILVCAFNLCCHGCPSKVKTPKDKKEYEIDSSISNDENRAKKK